MISTESSARRWRRPAHPHLLVAVVLASVGVAACSERPDGASVVNLDGARSARTAIGSRALTVLASNPRYFSDGSGRAVYLAGSHTWDNGQDLGHKPFAWIEYLDSLRAHNHNFIRLWVWEQARGLTTAPSPVNPTAVVTPELFTRTGPGVAGDGGLRFDLARPNPLYLSRLRQRVREARERGMYVSVMLFNGWSVERKRGGGDPWLAHPFNLANNVNGIDGDPDDAGNGTATHTLRVPAVTRIQEIYVRSVLDTLADLDNVLYEISNESRGDSRRWQYHLIDYIKRHESMRRRSHPVGMTSMWPGGSNRALVDSDADWISPGADDGYDENPPAAYRGKVVLSDTDHIWGIGGTRSWAWKSFTRGLNVAYMDAWRSHVIAVLPDEGLRTTLGSLRLYAERMDLTSMTPQPALASTAYCLANPGSSYLVYLPAAGDRMTTRFVTRAVKLLSPWIRRSVDVDLSAATGHLTVEWFIPATGRVVPAGVTQGGAVRHFVALFGGDAVLSLTRLDARGTAASASNVFR